jgi:muconate cycloisomerase
MKITHVETVSVVVPLHAGSWHSADYEPEGKTIGGAWFRQRWEEFPIVILRVHTDEGLVGLGEAPKGTPEEAVRRYASAFEGRELASFNLQDLPMDWLWGAQGGVYLAYETALLDLTGKALGLPVYRLFGGKYRDWVPVSRCSGRMNPAAAAAAARDAVARGYSVLKMKACPGDDMVARLGAVQDAVGDQLHIVVDANQTMGQPAQLFALDERLRAAGIHNVQCFESPFNHRNLDWYQLARQKLTTPIALHIPQPVDVIEAIKHEACDWLNIGSRPVITYKVAALAEAAGMPTWHGSNVGLGVVEAAHAHTCAACLSMTLTSDICGEVLRVDDLIREPLVIENGHVRVPEGPGLGVALDEEAVERYRVA